MAEMMAQLRSEGQEISSMAAMPGLASPHWKAMGPEERLKYERMAKGLDKKGAGEIENNRSVPLGPQGRRNCAGVLLSEIERQEKEKADKIQEVEDIVLRMRLNWPPGNALIHERFKVILFEYFVKTQEGEFFPCEVALVEFSMEKGVTTKYHSFIDPGECPTGYGYEEKLRSEERHKIPPVDRFQSFPEDKQRAIRDHAAIYDKLVNLASDCGVIRTPVVLTFGDEAEAVEGCFEFLRRKVYTDKEMPRVLPIEQVFRQFYEHSRSKTVCSVPSINSCQRTLTQFIWDYLTSLCCDFHQKDDHEKKFCVLAQVTRWCYHIFNAMRTNKVYDFVMTDKHMPTFDFNAVNNYAPEAVKILFALGSHNYI